MTLLDKITYGAYAFVAVVCFFGLCQMIMDCGRSSKDF